MRCNKNQIKTQSQNILVFLLVLLLSLLLCFSLALPCTSALGVSPASKTVDYEPGALQEYEFYIINSEQRSFTLSLGAYGDLEDYLFFENSTIDVNAGDYRTGFKVILKMPLDMEPGIHGGGIQINPVFSIGSEDMFVAYIAPRLPIKIRVPYPSKYVRASLSVLNVDEGTPVPINVLFDNLGSEDIASAWAKIRVSRPDNKLVAELETEDVSVRSNQLGRAPAKNRPALRRGLYYAVVNAYYDGQSLDFTANFSLGEPDVRITRLATRRLVSGEVNKILFLAYNDWNAELSIQGFIEVQAGTGGVGTGETGTRKAEGTETALEKQEMPVFTLQPQKEQEITAYYDASGLPIGDYNMTLTLVFEDQIMDKTYLVEVVEPEEKEKEKPSGQGIFLILALALAAIIAVLIIFVMLKKRKKRV